MGGEPRGLQVPQGTDMAARARAHTCHEPFLMFLGKCYHKDKDEKPPVPDERASANCSGAVSGFRGSCAPGHPETGTYLLHQVRWWSYVSGT